MTEKVQKTANMWLRSRNQPVLNIDGNYHHFVEDLHIHKDELGRFSSSEPVAAVMDVPASETHDSVFR